MSENPVINGCEDCEKLLVMSNDTDHNYHQSNEAGHFINFKKYTSSSNLIRPSDLMKKVLGNCEGKIKKVLPKVWGEKDITKKKVVT